MIIENLPSCEKFQIILNNGNGRIALQTGFVSENGKVQIDILDLAPDRYYYQLSYRTTILRKGMLIKQ